MTLLNECPACDTPHPKVYAQVAAQMHHSREIFTFERCDLCQLLMLNPRPTLDILRNYYGDYYLPYRGAAAWGRYRRLVKMDQVRLDTRRIKVLQQFGKLTPKSVVLDIGCGKPTFLQSINMQYGAKGIGVDFSDHGWSGQPSMFPNLDLHLKGPNEVQLDHPPDFITMWHYLEHDYFPLQTLRHLAGLSGPNTHLVIEVPNFDSASRKKYGFNWAGWHTPRHTFLFSPQNLSMLLEKSGWSIEKLELSGTLHNYLLYWMSELEQKETDWRGSMEKQFWGFVAGQAGFLLKSLFDNKASHGLMLLVATPAKT